MERRARQLEARGQVGDRYGLYHQIEERDARDRANPHGGFYPAPDAHLLDTTRLDIDAALRAAVAIVDGAMAQKARQKPLIQPSFASPFAIDQGPAPEHHPNRWLALL